RDERWVFCWRRDGATARGSRDVRPAQLCVPKTTHPVFSLALENDSPRARSSTPPEARVGMHSGVRRTGLGLARAALGGGAAFVAAVAVGHERVGGEVAGFAVVCEE